MIVCRVHSASGRVASRVLLGVATAALLAAAPAQAAPFVYVSNAVDDSVSQYNVGASGLLAPLSAPTVVAGEVPLQVAVSPDGESVYVANLVSDDLSQYDIGAGG